MATGAVGDEAAAATGAAPARTLTFLDLPIEAQSEILSHCSQSDLICVALVSKHFHELASSLLYRNFHIIFPDDDDLGFDSPIDGLAGGLDTFTTSEYNYAKHLKDISMDTLSAGNKGEHSYQSYLYSASCGKFLNTLLYLTLRKAKSLEAFRWNIRVELSRPVYRELHRIQSLKRLHLRMQAGESYYSTPPPLPASIDAHAITPSNHWPQVVPPSPDPLTGFSPALPTASLTAAPIGPPPALVQSNKPSLRNKLSKRSLSSSEPSTLSGFKDLQSLSVLDIDDLDIIPELKTCIRNSSSTLSELQLSFSDGLAMKARRPAPDSDPEESDVEDDFQVVPASQNNSYDASGPAKTYRAQEERTIQEAVLGKLLDVEPLLVKKLHMRPNSAKRGQSSGQEKQASQGESSMDPGAAFISSIKGLSTKLVSLVNGSSDLTLSHEEMLETIAKAAKKYVDSGNHLPSDKTPVATGEGSKASASGEKEKTGSGTPIGDTTKNANTEIPLVPKEDVGDKSGEAAPAAAAPVDKESSAESGTASKRKGTAGEASPDDIDIEHMETVEDASDDEEDHQAADGDADTQTQPGPAQAGESESTASPKLTPGTSHAGSSTAKESTIDETATPKFDFESLISKSYKLQEYAASLRENLQDLRSTGASLDYGQITNAEAQIAKLNRSVVDLRNQADLEGLKLIDLERKEPGKPSDQRNLRDYIHGTRGFSLETLAIHLVPVKASVLSRALNLSCLKSLTLLNVGNQTAIWTLLSKENKDTPLALRSVFTDNVSTAFLTCMSKLPELHELFMLERSAKQMPESFAPRSSTTIDQIRRLVLKKHMPTLKRLMIKDESNGPNSNWGVNEKAMILICTRGVKLEELAVSMNIHAVHAFMQYFSGLISLRAIHILHFKNNDTCIWVMREILKFIVDNLSHNPALKLEWIAMEDDRVDRVVRPSDFADADADEPPRKPGKGKGVLPVAPGLGFADAFPALPTEGLDSESESESEDLDSGTRLRFKTVGPLQFYDVWNVKIFEKEIRSGRL